MPQWRNPLPWKNTPETPNIGTWAQTDDIRPGLGWQGLANLESFVKRGGVLVGVENTAEFAVQFGLANGVSANQARRGEVVGTLLRSRIVDDASPIVYGVKDNLALYSSSGESFSVSTFAAGVAAAASAVAPTSRVRRVAARPTIRMSSRDASPISASTRRVRHRFNRGKRPR